jgi:hypothetical protein
MQLLAFGSGRVRLSSMSKEPGRSARDIHAKEVQVIVAGSRCLP